jgi:hypothetical protein
MIFQPKDKFVLYSFCFHPRNQKENYFFLLLTLESLLYFEGDSKSLKKIWTQSHSQSKCSMVSSSNGKQDLEHGEMIR